MNNRIVVVVHDGLTPARAHTDRRPAGHPLSTGTDTDGRYDDVDGTTRIDVADVACPIRHL